MAGRFDPAENRCYPAGDSRWDTDLKALVAKQGKTIKQLQAKLRDMKLSTSSVPVSSTPSRLCWTCNSPQPFQRNCPHFTGQSFGTPGWNGPFGQTGLPRHPDPTVTDHYSSFHITSECCDPSVFLDTNIWPEGSMVRWWCHKKDSASTYRMSSVTSDEHRVHTFM